MLCQSKLFLLFYAGKRVSYIAAHCGLHGPELGRGQLKAGHCNTVLGQSLSAGPAGLTFPCFPPSRTIGPCPSPPPPTPTEGPPTKEHYGGVRGEGYKWREKGWLPFASTLGGSFLFPELRFFPEVRGGLISQGTF